MRFCVCFPVEPIPADYKDACLKSVFLRLPSVMRDASQMGTDDTSSFSRVKPMSRNILSVSGGAFYLDLQFPGLPGNP